jgi:predicted DNA-binding protein (UPF0251 family)
MLNTCRRDYVTPRLKKPRNYACTLCSQYEQIFKPARTPLAQLEMTTIFQDEIEALFLCDSQDMDQKTAGEKMGVSRATVQRLLAKGRKKMIEALVQKKALAIVPTRNASAVAGEFDKTTGKQPVDKRSEPSGPCPGPATGCGAPAQMRNDFPT